MHIKCKITLQKITEVTLNYNFFIESLLKIFHNFCIHRQCGTHFNINKLPLKVDMSAFRLIFFPQLFNAHEKKHERAHPIKYKVLNHYWLHFVPPIYCLCLHDNVMKCECVMPWNMQTVNERQARVTFNFFVYSFLDAFFCWKCKKTTGNYTFDRAGWFVRVERNEKCKFCCKCWREQCCWNRFSFQVFTMIMNLPGNI